MEDLEGGWLPSINGFSSGVRSMMKDFGMTIFVSSSVHSKGTYGFATGIVVDVANIVVIIWLLLWLTAVVSMVGVLVPLVFTAAELDGIVRCCLLGLSSSLLGFLIGP